MNPLECFPPFNAPLMPSFADLLIIFSVRQFLELLRQMVMWSIQEKNRLLQSVGSSDTQQSEGRASLGFEYPGADTTPRLRRWSHSKIFIFFWFIFIRFYILPHCFGDWIYLLSNSNWEHTLGLFWSKGLSELKVQEVCLGQFPYRPFLSVVGFSTL